MTLILDIGVLSAMVYLTLGLCVYAITNIVRWTNGPFNIFVKFREFIGIKVIDVNGEKQEAVKDAFFAKLVDCSWCLSFWVAAIITGVFVLLMDTGWGPFPFGWLSATAVSGILHDRLNPR